MKRSWVLLQWVVLLGVIAVMVYSAVKPQPPPLYNPAAWKSWQGFFVLSYTGIVKGQEPDYVSPGLLDKQLLALRQAGYQTIKLQDALAFLQGRAPLPEKALLLLFEGDRKDSFLRATPLLQKQGFLANLCVPTKLTRSWGNFYLDEGEIKKVCRSPNWDVVSMGHQAIEPITLDAKGAQGHFLSHRQWLDHAVEDDAAFHRRILEDYRTAAETLQQACSRTVSAYLYPYADNGRGAGADPQAADLNRQGVEAHHVLAFTRAGDPFNGARSNPYALTRLRVPGAWDGVRLVTELEKYAPRQQPLVGLGTTDCWQFSAGPEMGAAGIQLPDGAFAWLRGTDSWQDLEVSATVSPAPGARVALYARYGGFQDYVRLNVNDQEVLLQERLGKTMQTLARQPSADLQRASFTLKLRIKGNRAWAWINDRPVVQAVPLTSHTDTGRVGVEAREASVLLTDFAATPLPGIFILANSYRNLDPSLQEEARAVLPRWFTPPQGPAIDASRRSDLLAAAAQGVETIPRLAPAPFSANGAATVAWAKDLKTLLTSGIYKILITTLAMAGGDQAMTAPLEKEGFRILLLLTPQEAQKLTPGQAGLTKKLLLINGPEPEARSALDHLLHFIPAAASSCGWPPPG